MKTDGSEQSEVVEGAQPDLNPLTDRIIGAAIEVHRHLGPGLLESIYEECLCYELSQAGLQFQRQVHLPIQYKGLRLESAYTMDLVVQDSVVVEIKATEGTAPVHCAQLLTYLRASNKRVGLLINFNVPVLKDGLHRIVHRYKGPGLPAARNSTNLDLGFSPRLHVSASKDVSQSKEGPLSAQALPTTGQPIDPHLDSSPRLRVSASNEAVLSEPAPQSTEVS